MALSEQNISTNFVCRLRNCVPHFCLPAAKGSKQLAWLATLVRSLLQDISVGCEDTDLLTNGGRFDLNLGLAQSIRRDLKRCDTHPNVQ